MENKLTPPFALLKQAWSLALSRPNLASYLALGVLPQLFLFAISAILAYSLGINDLQTTISNLITNTGTWGIAGVIAIGLGVVLIVSLVSTWYAALLYKVYQATITVNVSRLSAYILPAKEVTAHLLVTYIIFGLLSSVGFLLLIIPGIIITVRYMFAPMIAAVEDAAVKPFDESKRLVKGRFWKLVGRSILMVVCYNIPLSVLQAIHPLLGTVWAVTSPIFGLYFFLVYRDFKDTAIVATE